MKTNLLAFAALIVLPLRLLAQSPVGIWTNETKDASFEFKEESGRIIGRIRSLKQPNFKDGTPMRDIKNPDPNKRETPLVGLVFLKGFMPAGNGRWNNGTIYDPDNGKTYSSYMQMTGNDQIEVRGYIGVSLLGRSQHWTRVK